MTIQETEKAQRFNRANDFLARVVNEEDLKQIYAVYTAPKKVYWICVNNSSIPYFYDID